MEIQRLCMECDNEARVVVLSSKLRKEIAACVCHIHAHRWRGDNWLEPIERFMAQNQIDPDTVMDRNGVKL